MNSFIIKRLETCQLSACCMLLLCCLDSSAVGSVGEAVNSQTAGSSGAAKIASTAVGHKRAVPQGHMSSGKLLSCSTTEFELQCESDVDDEKAAKCPRREANVRTVISPRTDSMSGGVLVSNSTDDSKAVNTDCSAALDSSTAAGMRVLPHLKHKRNYNRKASHVICMQSE